jgi:hypothetical protein
LVHSSCDDCLFTYFSKSDEKKKRKILVSFMHASFSIVLKVFPKLVPLSMLNLFWDEDHFAMSPKMKTKEKALGGGSLTCNF